MFILAYDICKFVSNWSLKYMNLSRLILAHTFRYHYYILKGPQGSPSSLLNQLKDYQLFLTNIFLSLLE